MGKKNKSKVPTVVEVPMAEGMEDKQFLLHLEKRHAAEVKIENYNKLHAVDAWIGTYRAFHDRLHRIAVPGQYDHEHVTEEERPWD